MKNKYELTVKVKKTDGRCQNKIVGKDKVIRMMRQDAAPEDSARTPASIRRQYGF